MRIVTNTWRPNTRSQAGPVDQKFKVILSLYREIDSSLVETLYCLTKVGETDEKCTWSVWVNKHMKRVVEELAEQDLGGECYAHKIVGAKPFTLRIFPRKQQGLGGGSRISSHRALEALLSSCFCLSNRFRDPKSQRTHQAQVAFQVCVRPGSYTPGPPSAALRELPDQHFSPSELEWVTKEKGATLLYALLVRVE